MCLGVRLSFIAAVVLSAIGVALPQLPELALDRIPGDVREPLRKSYEAAQNNYRDADSIGHLGMMLHAYEQHESAEACYRRARVLEPGAFRWAYYLGTVQAISRKHTEAARNLRDAAELNPAYLLARLQLAKSLIETGELSESRKVLDFLIQRNPGWADAHYWRGRVLAARGELLSAAASFRKAYELAPTFGSAHYALALVLRDLGQAAEAEMHLAVYQKENARPPQVADPLLDAIDELGSGGALNHLRAGVRLEMAGSLEEAAGEQERAVNIQPDLIQAHINLISLYGKLGLIDQARRHYHQAMAINPNQSELHFNLGVVAASQNRLGEAAAAFERALEINPFHAEAYANLGQAMERLGRQDEAVHQYHKALENRPNYQQAYFFLGRAMLVQNKPADAIGFFIKSLVPEDEHTPLYLFGLATAYAALGDQEQAISRARKARLQAAALGQADLVKAIDQDLQTLEKPGKTP